MGLLVRIGTRGSPLALVQARSVAALLKAKDETLSVELVVIKTTGDKILDKPLASVGGKGLFVKEIEEALFNERIDLAVHSMKDVPAEIPKGLKIAAYPIREDPRDVLVSKDVASLSELGPGARVGTSSLRRAAQLHYMRPDLVVTPLRGNLDTRIKKLETEGLDAIVVAAAGVKRLGLEGSITAYLDEAIMIPAIGQGALGLEIRSDDTVMHTLASALDNRRTRVEVEGERAFLCTMEGGCQVPIAARGYLKHETIHLDGMVADVTGRPYIRGSLTGSADTAYAIGVRLAEDLLSRGGREILDSLSPDRNV